MSFKEAVKKFGKPYNEDKKILDDENVHRYFSEENIIKYLPEKKYKEEVRYIKEVTWKRLSVSWITVFYIRDGNVWKPFDISITM